MIDLTKVRAIDVHVHAEVSCHDPEDPVMGVTSTRRPPISRRRASDPKFPRSSACIASSRLHSVCFTVDCESSIGAKRVSNYEIAEYAAKNADIVIPFASIDPRKAGWARVKRATSSRITGFEGSNSMGSFRTFILPTVWPTRSMR